MNVSLGRRLLSLILALGTCAFGAVSMAAEPDVTADLPMPARLGVVEGRVHYWRPGMADWELAQLNAALAAGDAIYAGMRGTVEIQVGARDFVRLSENTMATLVGLDAGLLQVRVNSGIASFDLRSTSAGQLIEIDTPNAAFMAGGNGYYRVDILGDSSHLIVRRGGRATLNFADGRGLNVAASEEIVVSGRVSPTAESYMAPDTDAWDRWNYARSDYVAEALSNRYVPAGVYGSADLDQYGSWRVVDDYGAVWVPAVEPGWAPYSSGTWRWDAAYGWTWVDRAPWGWTTGHHGRWVFVGGLWAWAPGPRAARPIYAPALVTFFRDDGGIHWAPLGWGEPLLPWWGRPGFRGSPWWGGWAGPRLVNGTPVPPGARVDPSTIVFHHGRRPGAVIGMREDHFGREPVRGTQLPVPIGDRPAAATLSRILDRHPQPGVESFGPVPPAAPSTPLPAAPLGQRPGPERQPAQSPPMPVLRPMFQAEPAPERLRTIQEALRSATRNEPGIAGQPHGTGHGPGPGRAEGLPGQPASRQFPRGRE